MFGDACRGRAVNGTILELCGVSYKLGVELNLSSEVSYKQCTLLRPSDGTLSRRSSVLCIKYGLHVKSPSEFIVRDKGFTGVCGRDC